MVSHQKHLLAAISNDVLALYQSNLDSQTSEIERITSSVEGKSLNTEQYKAILGAKELWPLDSKPAKALLSHIPQLQLKTRAHKSPPQIVGTYILRGQEVDSLFIVPDAAKRPGLLVIKTIPIASLFPPGPVQVEVFAGHTTNPAKLIAKSRHFEPWHRRGMPPPPPMFGEPDKPSHFESEFRGPTLEKTLLLTGLSQTPIMTLRLRLRPPPPQPGTFGMTWVGALILLTGFLSSLLAGNYIQKNFVRPLLRLSLAARQVQQGDLSVRIETSSARQQDVRQTLENFNTMLEGLSEKEQLRNSFISNLTHDFRTPLIAQSRSLELLSKEFEQLGLPVQEKLAVSIVKNNEHLLTMVNQLLETYQTDAKMFKLHLHSMALSQLIDQCFEQLDSLAEERDIKLTQQFETDFPDIMMDDYYLKRVFINLIANAIQNIPKRSQIQVLGKQLEPNLVEIRVRDNGPGILPEELQHLFDRYYAGTGDTRKLGSGLGLYICKVLVTAHQGTIFVENAAGYTDFVIQLPILKPEVTDELPH